MEIQLFSHGDVDGIASAAIIGRTLNILYGWSGEPIFCEPHNFEVFINKYALERNIIVDVYMATLEGIKAIPLENIEKIYDYFKFRISLENKETPFLIVLDHHPNIEKSNTLLLQHFIGATNYLVNLGLAGDVRRVLTKSREIIKHARMLRGAISYNVEDEEFRKFIYRELMKGRRVPEIEGVKERYKEFKQKLTSLISGYEEHIFYDDGRNVVLDWELGRGYVGVVAGTLTGKLNKNIFIVRKIEDEYVMTYRGVDRLLWIGDEIKKRDVAYVTHGGHEKAFSYTTKASKTELLAMLIDILKNMSYTEVIE